ncbi:MAG: Na/Pi cotransporter family protein [candidate division WS1 bacterium]|nr:Na/Pi cotransporter family protein [candidate division WS1 bacterium]
MTGIDWFAVASGSVGGVALLMYGIRIMGEGLEAAAGDALRRILAALTRNAWLACLLGAVVTGVVQSSSAVTVMTVGFVNAQLMTFRQALGVIYGANIGTTVTGQIMAFEITQLALPAIALGFGMQYFSRRRVVRNLGQGMLGFGLLFLGLMLLKGSVESLKESQMAVGIFTMFSHNLLLAVGAGVLVTILIQSSSASLGIAMALAAHNLISLEAAIALMLGDNIGTCITAQLASIGTQTTARRTAWAHTIHNIVGVALVLIVLRWFIPLVLHLSPSIVGLDPLSEVYQAAVQRQVANSHTLFNVLNAILFLIFNNFFATWLERWFPERGRLAEASHIDRRLLETPAAAAGATLQELARMARACRQLVKGATGAVLEPERVDTAPLWAEDDAIDQLQEDITSYLVDLMEEDIPEFISAQVPAMLHVANDLERVGDHCKNLLELAEQRRDHGMPWSDTADDSVRQMAALIDEMLTAAAEALGGRNEGRIQRVLELEKIVDHLTEEGRNEHLERARHGECLMLPGVLYLDALMNYEKIGDHVRNIGRALAGGLMDAGTTMPYTAEGEAAAAEDA